jgi:hypothetical protein
LYHLTRPEAIGDDLASLEWMLVIPFFGLHMLVILFGIGLFTTAIFGRKSINKQQPQNL